MTSPAKFKKDKEIIAEYDTQVKGKGLESSITHMIWGPLRHVFPS